MNKNIPQLRFKGFKDDWDQRKLGSLLTERNEQVPESFEYPLMSFVQGEGVTPKGERYDRSFLVKDTKKKYKKTELDDFIYSSNNLETGSIGVNKSGSAVISPVYSIFYSKTELESQLIGILSTRRDFLNKMIRFRQGVVYGQWRIHEKDFLSIKILVPNGAEQANIVNFFRKLDDTIALHQHKLELLKDQKKGFLQKMFPKNDEKMPELRFKGLTGDWEQRKFSEIVNRVSKSSDEQGLPRVEYEDIISGEGVLNKDIFEKVSEKKGTEFLPGDTLYGKLRPYLKNWLYADFKGIAVGDFWVLRPIDSNNEFVYSLIQSDKYQLVANQSSGTKMPRSDWSTVSNTEFLIPNNLDEQKKVGTFFKTLEDTIALQERKLELLKEQKKAFLQKMFV